MSNPVYSESQTKFVSPEQASVLSTGLSVVGIEKISEVFEFNDFLRAASRSERGSPVRFEDTAREVSKLVLRSEIDHMSGLINSGRVNEVNQRIASEFGLVSKLNTLSPFLEQ